MPAGLFSPRRVPDHGARTKQIEDFLERLSADVVTLAQLRAAARNTGGAALAAAAGVSGGGGGGGTGVLSGDVTGPEASTLVSLLQGATLTLTSPTTGQVIVFNGTAWVNTNDIPGDLIVDAVLRTGGFRTAVATKTGPYTLVYTDELIEADASGGPFTLVLPTAVGHAGHWFEIKKVDGSANAVTVAFTASQTADGTAPIVIRIPETLLGFRSDGTNYVIF